MIGDDTRSFLSVVQSLGRCGCIVDVLMHRPNIISASSRYINQNHKIAPIAQGAEKWLRGVAHLQREYEYDLIIPCDDSALLPFMRLLDSPAFAEGEMDSLKAATIATPGSRAFDIFYDKKKTLKACNELYIPVARRADAVAGSLEDLTFPLVLKPNSSFTLENLASKDCVSILHTMEEAKHAIADLAEPAAYFLEEFFDGVGIGISVLASAGLVTHAFQHIRIDEGVSGGSSLRQSLPLDKRMLTEVERFADYADLEGVAMFEFRQNRQTGAYILLEVNARFWGSLPLAIYAGVDFPALLLARQAEKLLNLPRPLPVRCTAPARLTKYKIGRRARALTASFYDTLRKIAAANGLAEKANAVLPVFAGGLRVLVLREKVDSFAFLDPKPFWVEMTGLLSMVLKGVSRRIGLSTLLRARRARKIMQKLATGRRPLQRILILCYGNICRSPYAAAVLEKALEKAANTTQKIDTITVCSAGFHLVEDRGAPADALETAAQHSVRLEKHRSRFADAGRIEAADLIIVFDEQNENDLAAFYPEAKARCLNLGDLQVKPQDITDPYGRGPEAFSTCYVAIDAATAQFTALLETP